MKINFTINEVANTMQQLWLAGKAYKVWAFHGEMGTGKTTCIHALCDYLQVSSTTGSPTYSIINEYASKVAGTIYHMDWYRLKDEEEALQAGVEDALHSNHLCLVEWPEKAPGLLPETTFHIYLSLVANYSRMIETKVHQP